MRIPFYTPGVYRSKFPRCSAFFCPKFSVGVLHSLLVILLARDLHVVAGDNCYEHLYLSLSALIVLKQLSLIVCK